jgi:hypothetical protein
MTNRDAHGQVAENQRDRAGPLVATGLSRSGLGHTIDTAMPALIGRGALGQPVDAERGIVPFRAAPPALVQRGGGVL